MKNGLKAKILLSESFSVRTPTGPMWNMFCRITSSLWELRHINPARNDLGNSYRMKRKLRNSCSQQERNKRPFHDSVGFASCVRASLTLPRAILRKASEKAGAGMCRLGLGQGGNLVYVHTFASSATEVFQRFTILMRSGASLRKFQTTWRVTKER